MVRVSNLAAPETDRVTVTVSVPTEMLAEVMSLLGANDTLPALVLNRHPRGNVRIKVLLLPIPKSVVDASASTMFPSAVNAAPLVEFSDLSAEISLPPAGSVTVTSASIRHEPNNNMPATRANRSNCLFIRVSLGALLASHCRKIAAEKLSVGWESAIDLPLPPG